MLSIHDCGDFLQNKCAEIRAKIYYENMGCWTFCCFMATLRINMVLIAEKETPFNPIEIGSKPNAILYGIFLSDLNKNPN